MSSRVVAIVGSYVRGGTTDNAVEAVLAGAREKGAVTHTIYLTEKQLLYCKNCRKCTLQAGPDRGHCGQRDDLEAILAEIEASDALVLGSPINFGNVTAVFRTFLERLIGCFYWPWDQGTPKPRILHPTKKAALVATAGMPAIFIPLFTGVGKTLNLTAKLLGARPVGQLWVGLSAMEPQHPISTRARERARRIGWKLA